MRANVQAECTEEGHGGHDHESCAVLPLATQWRTAIRMAFSSPGYKPSSSESVLTTLCKKLMTFMQWGLIQSAAPWPTPATINNQDLRLRRADRFLFVSLLS